MRRAPPARRPARNHHRRTMIVASDNHLQPLATMPRNATDRLLRLRDCIDCGGRISSRNQSGRCASCNGRHNMHAAVHPHIAALPSEERSARAAKAAHDKSARLGPAERKEVSRTMREATTPEERVEYARRANAAVTPEHLRSRYDNETHEQRSERSKRAHASLTPEQRSERARRAQASQSPEQKREARAKAWATRRRSSLECNANVTAKGA